jgi:hypothetical protein
MGIMLDVLSDELLEPTSPVLSRLAWVFGLLPCLVVMYVLQTLDIAALNCRVQIFSRMGMGEERRGAGAHRN